MSRRLGIFLDLTQQNKKESSSGEVKSGLPFFGRPLHQSLWCFIKLAYAKFIKHWEDFGGEVPADSPRPHFLGRTCYFLRNGLQYYGLLVEKGACS